MPWYRLRLRVSDPDRKLWLKMHGPPALGLASTVRLLQAWEQDSKLHSYFGNLLDVKFQ